MASPALVAEAAEAALEAEEAADIVVRARIAHDLEEVERGELDKTAEEIVAERIAEEAHLGEDIPEEVRPARCRFRPRLRPVDGRLRRWLHARFRLDQRHLGRLGGTHD